MAYIMLFKSFYAFTLLLKIPKCNTVNAIIRALHIYLILTVLR